MICLIELTKPVISVTLFVEVAASCLPRTPTHQVDAKERMLVCMTEMTALAGSFSLLHLKSVLISSPVDNMLQSCDYLIY